MLASSRFDFDPRNQWLIVFKLETIYNKISKISIIDEEY